MGFYYVASQEGKVLSKSVEKSLVLILSLLLHRLWAAREEKEESNGLFRELISGREKLLEELCFECFDAFLKAGCCSLAIWSKYLVFCLSFLSDLPLVTAVLVVGFSYSVVILMHLCYRVLIFIFSILPLCCVTAAFIRLPSAQIVQHVILKAALMSCSENALNQTIHASALKEKKKI